jgi:hypothetical protein
MPLAPQHDPSTDGLAWREQHPQKQIGPREPRSQVQELPPDPAPAPDPQPDPAPDPAPEPAQTPQEGGPDA